MKGILFDAAGDPMVATHATKRGVRYRYYVSQPYLRGLATPPIGAIVRVPAPDIEAVVSKALREYLARSNTAAAQASSADQPNIRAMVARIEVRNSHLAVWLMHVSQPYLRGLAMPPIGAIVRATGRRLSQLCLPYVRGRLRSCTCSECSSRLVQGAVPV